MFSCIGISIWLLLHIAGISIAAECDAVEKSSECWYEEWYIWVAVAFLLVVVITIIVLCYQHSKKRTHVRVTPREPVVFAARQPPPYSSPGHNPPSYEDALTQSYPAPIGYV